jgi:hypothetical protein
LKLETALAALKALSPEERLKLAALLLVDAKDQTHSEQA